MAETVALVSIIGTVSVSVISELRDSRCTKIETPCITCDRQPVEISPGEKESAESDFVPIPVNIEKENNSNQ
tara:strand:+ start:5939 stop:6154 length:216 start_codon:yes stop_codon:yes gene_type:complete